MNALASAAAGHNYEALEEAIDMIPIVSRPLELGQVLHLTISPATNIALQMNCFLLLLAKGADVNVPDGSGLTPLHVASCVDFLVDFVGPLLEQGANLEARNLDLRTPLHLACFNRNSECVELLLEWGADANAQTLLLNHGANIEARNRTGWTPLHFACLLNKRNCVQLLLHSQADAEALTDGHRLTPLMLACRKQHIECLQVLLARPVDLAAVDIKGRTALHHACSLNDSLLVIELLIGSGANPNVADLSGKTPLHLLCAMGDSRGLPVLLLAGAAVGATDFSGDTPLHSAAWRLDEFMEDQVAIITGLLVAGANRGSVNHSGRTPAQVASNLGARDLLLQ